MPIGPARMPLFDHMGELRRRLVIVVVSLIIAACVLYIATPQIITFLIEPIRPYLPEGDDILVVLNPLGGFTVRFKVAFFSAAIACSPIVLWEFLAFFLPALKPSERKWFLPTFVVGVVLFIIGTIFCYFIILDPAFEWMLAQTDEIATILPDATEYIKLIMLFEIGFGIAFELPLIVFYLIVFNVVPYKTFRKSWRTVYLVLMLVSAMVTPDASPVTMLLMFAAMAGLYELSLFVSRLVLSKKIKAQNSKAEAEEIAEEIGIKLKDDESADTAKSKGATKSNAKK